jgi:hypothetical protein
MSNTSSFSTIVDLGNCCADVAPLMLIRNSAGCHIEEVAPIGWDYERRRHLE